MTRIQGLGIVLAGALLTTLVSGGCGSSDDVVDVTGTVNSMVNR